MQNEAARLQAEILTIVRDTLTGRVTVGHVMKVLGAKSGDPKPRNALDALARQGLLVKDMNARPHSYALPPVPASPATPKPAPQPASEPAAEDAGAEPEVTEADIEVEPGPTSRMTTVASDEKLSALRTKLGDAVNKAASDEGAISAARQEAITDLIHEHGPQLGAEIVSSLGLQKEEVVAALRTMIKAGVLTRSGGQGAPFELVQRGVMELLGDDVLAVCAGCSKEIARGPASAEMLRTIFGHDSTHDVRVRGKSGTFSRKQLEKIDAEQKAATPKPAPQGPSAEEVVTFRLPDGRDYAPRLVAGTNTPDVEMLRLLRDNNSPACLYGPPGTGKTAVVGAAFEDALTINGDGDTAVADFVGTWTMSGDPAQPYVWADGPLTTAMKEGRVLFIDDFTLISGKVLSVLYPVMDGRGRIFLKEHPIKQDDGSFRPEMVEAQKGFWIVGGHNPGVHGAVLSPALASRFALHIQVPSDYELAERMGINRKAIKVARNLQTAAEAGNVGWWPQLRELMAFEKIATLLGEDAAIANLAGICPEEDRSEVIKELKNCFGKEVEPLQLGHKIG